MKKIPTIMGGGCPEYNEMNKINKFIEELKEYDIHDGNLLIPIKDLDKLTKKYNSQKIKKVGIKVPSTDKVFPVFSDTLRGLCKNCGYIRKFHESKEIPENFDDGMTQVAPKGMFKAKGSDEE